MLYLALSDMLKKFIPVKYHYLLSNIKKATFDGFGKKYYSQFGEDIVISRLLNKRKGFYIDVGAHHPKRYSNTYLLFKKGWRGINIDANPHTITLFNRTRPKDTNICVGVGKPGELEYYSFSDPAVNTFMETEAEKWMDKKWITFLGKETLAIRPLRDVLLEVTELPHIDVFNIDVEGMDYDVLESFPWERDVPTIIVVESHDFRSDAPQKCPSYTFLTQKGYHLYSYVGPSLVFTR